MLEQEIGTMESRKNDLERLLADPEYYKSEARVRSGTAEYAEIRTALDRAYHEWEELNRAVEDSGKSPAA
jgi:ATP-binding cassette subfamily F protein 3